MQHSAVIIAIANCNHMIWTELFNIFFLLYVLVFAGKEYCLALYVLKFLLGSAKCISGNNMYGKKLSDFIELLLTPGISFPSTESVPVKSETRCSSFTVPKPGIIISSI